MARVLNLFAIAAVLVLVGACTEGVTRRGPAPIGMSSGNVTMAKVTAAILKAAPRAKWTATLIRPGLIEAKRVWGGGRHSIDVEVVYDAKNYEINYKNSSGLKYTGGSVHPAYNFQVGELSRAIKAATWAM